MLHPSTFPEEGGTCKSGEWKQLLWEGHLLPRSAVKQEKPSGLFSLSQPQRRQGPYHLGWASFPDPQLGQVCLLRPLPLPLERDIRGKRSWQPRSSSQEGGSPVDACVKQREGEWGRTAVMRGGKPSPPDFSPWGGIKESTGNTQSRGGTDFQEQTGQWIGLLMNHQAAANAWPL